MSVSRICFHEGGGSAAHCDFVYRFLSVQEVGGIGLAVVTRRAIDLKICGWSPAHGSSRIAG